MSDAVDTRVVEAKFDAEDFEKGVDKTLKKLDELKKSLNMKDSGKSVTEFSKITSEATEKANSSLEKLTNRLTTFTGMLKNQLVSGLAGEVSGAFLRMEQSITGFFNTITSGAINNGMNRYTEILTSVRTMVAAGKDQAVAYEQIKLLGEYADQTSYNLAQMAGTMSKMVAAGAGVEEARKSVEGLANMAAAAGVNIYDANRALLNFSQAYSSGTMRIQDWISFESLNMSTEKTMKLFMEAGVMSGTLVKTVKKNAKGAEETVYKTVNKTNKKIQSGKQVAIKGFRDTLRYGWLDQTTMKNATALLSFYDEYGGDVEHLTEEQLEQAKAMYGAAREARSFADVMGTLKDVLATGWSESFEHIFGQLEKATKFFTDLADSNILGILYDLSEYRNSILETWNSLTTGGKNGSDLFLQGLLNIDEAVGKISESVKKLFPDAEYMGRLLFQKTVEFEEATRNIIDWLGKASGNDEETRADKIAKILGIVGTAFSVVSKVVGTAVRSIDIIVKAFSPVIDAVISTLSRFADSLAMTNQNTSVFDDMANAVQNVMVAAEPLLKILPPIIEFLGMIGTFFVDSAIATVTMNVELFSDALGFMLELLGAKSAQEINDPNQSVLARITRSVTDMKNAMSQTITAVKEFMGYLIADLKTLLGIGEIAEGEEGGFFTNVSNFFKTNTFVADAKAWIDQAIKDVGAFIKDIPNRLRQYAFNVWEFFHGLFYQKEDLSGMTGAGHGAVSMEITDAEVATPLKLWLDGVIEKVQNFVKTIPERIAEAAHTFGTVIGRTVESLIAFFLGDKVAQFELTKVDANGDIKTKDMIVRDTLNSGFNTMLNTAVNFVKDIPKNVKNAIKNIGTILENFWDGLFYEKYGKTVSIDKNGKKYWKDIKVKTPLKKFIDKAIKEAAEFIKKIPEYVRDGLRSAGSVLGNLVSALFGKKDGEATSKDVEDAVMKPFANFSLSGLYAKIKEIATNVSNWVMSIFTGSDDLETNQTIFAEKVAAGITWIKEHAENAWTKISTWFTELPHKIATFFSGERIADETNKEAKDMGPVEKAVRGFAESIGHFIESLPDTLLTFFDNAIFEIGKLWDRLYNALTGHGTDGKSQNELLNAGQSGYTKEASRIANILNDSAPDAEKVKVSKWEMFTRHLGKTISNLFATIPTYIAEGIDLAIKGIDWAVSGITNWFKFGNVKSTLETESENTGKQIVKEVGKNTEEGAENGTTLMEALGNIGASISKLITKTVPGFLTEGWNFVKNNAGGWWDALTSIFDAYNTSDLKVKVDGLGQTIETFIKDIPKYIRSGIDWISDRLHGRQNRKDFVADQILEQMMGVKSGQLPVYMKTKLDKELGEGAKESQTAIQNAPIWDFTTGTWSKKLNETAENIKEETDDGGIWGIVKSIGESIQYAFSQIGPYIINGFNTALEWINKGISWMTNFLTNRDKTKPLTEDLKEAIAGEDGENKELADSMFTLGTTLKTTMVETIPQFIQEGAKEVAASAPNILEMLFGGLVSSAKADEAYTAVTDKITENCDAAASELTESIDKVVKEKFVSFTERQGLLKAGKIKSLWEPIYEEVLPGEEDVDKTKKKAENATTLIGTIKGVFDSIGPLLDSDLGRVSVVLVAAGFLLFQLKDMLSFTDEVESFGWTAKWQAIKIGIGGMIATLAYLCFLVQKDTPNDTKLEDTLNILEKLGDFIERVLSLITIIMAASGLGKGFEAIGYIFGGKGETGSTGLLTNILGWLSGLGKGVITAEVVGGTVQGMFEKLSNILGDFGSGVSDFLDFLVPVVTNLADMFTPLDNAIASVGKISTLISELNGLYTKTDVLLSNGMFAEENGDMIKSLESIYGSENGQLSLSLSQDRMNDVMSYFVGISTFMKNLTESLHAFDGIENPEGEMQKVADLITSDAFKDFMENMNEELINWIVPFGSDQIADMSTSFTLLADALSVFGTGIRDMTPESVTALDQTLGTFTKLAEALSNNGNALHRVMFGDDSISKFGREIRSFGNSIKNFFDNVSSIKMNDTSAADLLERKAALVVKVAKDMADVTNSVFTAGTLKNFTDFSDELPEVGTSLAKFINGAVEGIDPKIGADKLAGVVSITEILKNVALSMESLDTTNIPHAVEQIGTAIEHFAESADAGDPKFVTYIKTFAQTVQDLISDDLNLTPTITPIIDMSNVDEAFNSRFGPDWKFNFDPGTVQAQLANPANANGANVINTQVDLSGINSKLDSVNIYLSSILAKNPAYNVYMDTGALVGSMGPQMYNYISAENMRRGRT